MQESPSWIERAAALVLARSILGLLFLMAGWYKVFVLGAAQHAQEFFVDAYSDSWIPVFVLQALGSAIPFLELAAGLLLVIGFRIREALLTVAAVLALVTYGHLLAEPMFDITPQIFPRAALTLFLLFVPREMDRWSLDAWLSTKRRREG